MSSGSGLATGTLRIGLVGCGRIARRFHLPILAAMAGVEVVAVADPDPEARAVAAALAPRARLLPSAGELLETRDIDAVVLCLPPDQHAETALAALSRRLAVYVEKPLATSLEDGRRVVSAWRSAASPASPASPAMVGFNFRFHPLVEEMRARLAAGEIGDIVALRTTFGAARRELPPWKQVRRSGGGALLDLAGHHFDLARHLLGGELVEVGAILRSVRSEEDTAVAMARLTSGPLVSISVSLAAVEEDRVEVTGTNGQLQLDRYRSSRLRTVPARRPLGARSRWRSLLGTLGSAPSAFADLLLPRREPSFRRAIESFVAAARQGRPASPDLADGLASLVAIDAAERAARAGAGVATPTTPERAAPRTA